MIKQISIAVSLVFFIAASALAQDGAVGDGARRVSFRLDPAVDVILIGSGVAANGTVFYLKTSRINRVDYDGDVLDSSSVNGLDRFFMNPYSKSLDYLGTGLSVASALTPAILLTTERDEWLTIGTMYAETMFLAYGLKELGKICVNRERPFMYSDGYPQDAVDDNDWNKSFPSGHTTLAFAGATFTSYVFSEYYPDSRMKVPVIVSSYALALGTAACRVSSGDHFLTDVIAGAAIGSACGFFVPWLHTLNAKSRKGISGIPQNYSVQVLPQGFLLSVNY